MQESGTVAPRDVSSVLNAFECSGPHGQADLLLLPVFDLFAEPYQEVNSFIIQVLWLSLLEFEHLMLQFLGVLDLLMEHMQ